MDYTIKKIDSHIDYLFKQTVKFQIQVKYVVIDKAEKEYIYSDTLLAVQRKFCGSYCQELQASDEVRPLLIENYINITKHFIIQAVSDGLL